MYAARATQFAKTITMACSVQKQPSQPPLSRSKPATTGSAPNVATDPGTPKPSIGPRGSLPTDVHQPPLEFQWPPPIPVSSHTSNLRLTMMNHDPKDLHTARLIIEELRTKVRFQTEHIMKWRKAYAIQVQQHYRYQKEKSDQMNALTSQLLLLESRLKRKQKQIANLLNHREQTIQRQQKIIDTLSSRLVDHGLETIETMNYTTELDSLNDSDSAVVLEEIDSDSNMPFGSRRRSSGGGGGGLGGVGGDGITIVRSISDAIETNLNKYGGARRNNCFLRRPEILETVYSVEEDPEPTTDVAEKRDKFRQRSEKALSSSSTEGQIDNTPPNSADKTKDVSATHHHPHPLGHNNYNNTSRQLSSPTPLQRTPTQDGYTAYSMRVPQRTTATLDNASLDENSPEPAVKSQVTNYNRVMSNHRSVTKPKDVKYKRINKAKSKSLEELRGRLKNLVERGGVKDAGLPSVATGGGYTPNMLPQTAQSYA